MMDYAQGIEADKLPRAAAATLALYRRKHSRN